MKNIEVILEEINGRLKLLEDNLPKRVDGFALSRSKLPFKALSYRESLAWRMAELSRAAFESFGKKQIATAILLTRGAVETSAALWYLSAKVKAAVDVATVGDVNEYLMRLMMGSRVNPDLPSAVNVLNLVDLVEKDVEGFRRQYDELSEFAHPNWAGTTLLYAQFDTANAVANYGSNIRGLDSPHNAGVVNLHAALLLFEHSYKRLSDVMPGFVQLCERNLQG